MASSWLQRTGRLPAVLAAWGRGALGEAPTGTAWDTVRIPATVAYETVARLRDGGAPVGPVLLTPPGVDFLVAVGSAGGWDTPDSSVLPAHTLVLLPHPETFAEPYHLAGRSWIVPPTGTEALTAGPDLRDAYRAARAIAVEVQR
ncbi:hypothetical protein F0L17_09475 [Streptomyces sp. TRM43335]|uniref:DNA primase/polymerase bifunctional N-terminal domain-containing protein n=1 Tax=Streptomyces taklimakanensis TaxID=2569853 RepID=A0A6G2BBB4_9ACTN|nr:hypothetical protein [Streptomyces taklimakanensis]MTE19353.1 hypothetical protein [Streptomyces taklimakanensis]